MPRIQRALTATATACVLALGACGTATTAESSRQDIELKDPVLVRNGDGTATLSATIVNHTDHNIGLNDGGIGEPYGEFSAYLAVYGRDEVLTPGSTTHIGDTDDPIRIRVRESTNLATSTPLWLNFVTDNTSELLTPKFTARLVERTAEHGDVAGEGPSTEIQVKDAVIVVVPGQQKAYVGGIVVSEIDDMAWTLPTAKDAQGKPVRYRHQTATGGPYGLAARTGKPLAFGGPPYRVPEADQIGDADYFNASDVTVGETITVTIPFQSGNVVAPFKVVSE